MPLELNSIWALLKPVIGDRGHVLLSQLNDCLPIEMTPEELDLVFLELDDRGIEVVDDESQKKPTAVPVFCESLMSEDPHVEEAEEPKDLEAEDQFLLSNLKWYVGEIGKTPRLGQAEELSLGRRARGGDPQAVTLMVNSNLRLVVSVARNYLRSGANLMDLIQAGNEGLLEAAKRFDPDRHGRFASFAPWWIRQPILKHIASSWHTMRVPPSVAKLSKRFVETRARLRERLARQPSNTELARELDLPLREVELLDSLLQLPISLDAPVAGKDGLTFEDILPDPLVKAPLGESLRLSLRATIDECLDRLDVTERRVLRLRYGLEDDVARSLEELAEMTGMDKESLKEVEERGLRKLRELSWSLKREGDESES